jgi:hypothetical protein
MRRLWDIQAKDRSTIHLLGKNGLGPSSGSSFFQSTTTPSLAHSAEALLELLFRQFQYGVLGSHLAKTMR